MNEQPLYACFVCGQDLDWYGECDACVEQRERQQIEEAQRLAEEKRRADYIASLRAVADFIEGHPAVPTPYCGASICVFVNTKEELAQLVRMAGVSWDKSGDDHWFRLVKTFGEDSGASTYHVNIERGSVCTKKVTGTRIQPAQPEREVEEYVWECADSLLAGDRR